MDHSKIYAYLEEDFINMNKPNSNKILRFWPPGGEQIEYFATDIVLRAVQLMVCEQMTRTDDPHTRSLSMVQTLSPFQQPIPSVWAMTCGPAPTADSEPLTRLTDISLSSSCHLVFAALTDTGQGEVMQRYSWKRI